MSETTTAPLAADHGAVFDHFGVPAADRPERSVYLYSPVFHVAIDGIDCALKRTRRTPAIAHGMARWLTEAVKAGVPVVSPAAVTAENPFLIGDRHWVAYPWITGRGYDGSGADVVAAGDLLGRLHAAGIPADKALSLAWPQPTADDITEDIDAINRILPAAGIEPDRVEWFRALLTGYGDRETAALREAGLPACFCSMDYKADNLIYTASGPVLIDPDNGDLAPRILDLAMAALQFHNEFAAAPPRPFSPREWVLFRDAYYRHITLTDAEYAMWETAMRFVIADEVVWTITDGDELGDWDRPHQGAFLRALTRCDAEHFPLGSGRIR